MVTAVGSGRAPRFRSGKTLTPLVSVLAVLAMIVAGVASWLWQGEREQRQAKERELLLVLAERDDLMGQVRELEQVKAKIASDLERTQGELDGTREKLSQTVQANEQLTQSVEDRQREIDRLAKDMAQLKQERQSLLAQVKDLETERSTIDQQLTELKDSNEQLEAKMQELSGPTVELDKVLVTGDGASLPAGAVGPTSVLPGLNGQVIVVNREYDFIVMNLGKHHGLSVGQEFQVVRDDQVLGRVKVEKAYDELSAAALLPESQEDSIREGDAVRSL